MLTLAILALFTGFQAQDDPVRLARELVEKLHSDKIEERDEATRKLMKLGLVAVPDLEKAAESADREVAERAASLVRIIRVRQELSPTILKALPGADERLAGGKDHAWMEVLLDATEVEKRIGVPWTAEDLGPLVRRAIKGAGTEADQDVIRRLIVGRKLRTAIPALVESYLREQSYVGPFSRALEQMRAPESIPPLLRASQEGPSRMRIRAAYLLGVIRSKEAIPVLLRMLDDPEPEAGETAAWALCRLRATEGIPGIAAFIDSKHPNLRCAAVLVLPLMGAKSEVPGIARLLDDPQGIVKAHAALALGELGARERVPWILPLLQDPDLEVRWFASSALGKLGDPQSIGPLIGLLVDSQSRVRCAAAQALGELGATDALGHLRTALKDGSGEVRRGALDALVSLNIRAEARFIRPLVTDEDRWVRVSAIGALWSLQDGAAASVIVDRLNDRESEVAGAAATWLCRMGRREGVPTLLNGKHPLWPLNLLRLPRDWDLVNKTELPGGREALAREHLDFLARRHGRVLDWSDRLSELDPPWTSRWTLSGKSSGPGPLEDLAGIAGDRGEVILESDRLRVVPPDEALRFWKAWWDQESAKDR